MNQLPLIECYEIMKHGYYVSYSNNGYRHFYTKDQRRLHRIDGPAVFCKKGNYESYYFNGILYTEDKDKWNQVTKKLKIGYKNDNN